MLQVKTIREKFEGIEAVIEITFGKPPAPPPQGEGSSPAVLGPVTIWASAVGGEGLALGSTQIVGRSCVTGEIFSSMLIPDDAEDSNEDSDYFNKMVATRILKAVPEYPQMFVSCTGLAKIDRRIEKLIEKRIIEELIKFKSEL